MTTTANDHAENATRYAASAESAAERVRDALAELEDSVTLAMRRGIIDRETAAEYLAKHIADARADAATAQEHAQTAYRAAQDAATLTNPRSSAQAIRHAETREHVAPEYRKG